MVNLVLILVSWLGLSDNTFLTNLTTQTVARSLKGVSISGLGVGIKGSVECVWSLTKSQNISASAASSLWINCCLLRVTQLRVGVVQY